MSQIFDLKVGRKHALYLPRALVALLGIREGSKLRLTVEGSRISLTLVKDPIDLAVEGSKMAEVKPEDIESTSLEEQQGYLRGSPGH